MIDSPGEIWCTAFFGYMEPPFTSCRNRAEPYERNLEPGIKHLSVFTVCVISDYISAFPNTEARDCSGVWNSLNTEYMMSRK